MNLFVEKIASAIRVQELVLVIVCCLSIYLLRARDSFMLQPAWHQELNPKGYENTRFPTRDEWLPGPVITDLDGDNVVEVVLVTTECELRVTKVPAQNKTEFRLPDLITLHSIKLLSDSDEGLRFGRPVALETGYLASPMSLTEKRKQVIVVVLADWRVLCYNSELTLLWTRTLIATGFERRHYFVKAMGILITPHALQKGDEGSVIVGGSYGHRDHDARLKSLHMEDFRKTGSGQNETSDIYTHFSTFALSGSDGSVRWHHLPGDFEQKISRDVDQSRLHWKLTLKRGKWHTGEVHWNKYARNIMKHMPHSWRNIRDTKFDLSDLSKAAVVSNHVKPRRSSEELAQLKDIIDFEGEHLIGIQYGGMKPHSRHEHVRHPTAIVIHNDEGIEVLDVNTGQPLTHLDLMAGRRPSTFVDVNEDGTIEEVRANFVLKCQAEVSVIQPRPKAIFTGPLCDSPFWWGGVSLSNLFYTPEVVSEDTHLAVAPVIVKSIAKSHGVFTHLLGKALPSERKGYDSIFLTSTGRLTSYSATGQPNWQVVLPVSWSGMTFQAETDSSFASTKNGEVFSSSFQPSVKPLALQLYAKQSAILVSGWDAVSLVDLREGFVLGHHTLPCQPIQAPVLGDLNNDGWTDFIISCPDAHIGFEIHRASSLTYSCTVAVAVVLSVALLVWCCQRNPDD